MGGAFLGGWLLFSALRFGGLRLVSLVRCWCVVGALLV